MNLITITVLFRLRRKYDVSMLSMQKRPESAGKKFTGGFDFGQHHGR